MADKSNAQIGKGVTIRIWDSFVSSPPAYVTIGKIRQATDILGSEKPEVNSTTLDSTTEEFISGMPIGKQFSVVVTVTAASLALFEAIDAQDDNVEFEVMIPAPTTQTRYFSGTFLGYASGTTAPSTLKEFTVNFRRTGATTSVDPHA